MAQEPDSVLRAVTHDGSFRVIAAQTTETIRGALKSQTASPETSRIFADMLTGAVLVRESMAPDLRVQAVLQGDDKRSRIVADSHPDGMTRGLVQLATNVKELKVGAEGILQVHRTMHNGALHQGVVAVPEGGDVSGAFMRYMQESEQVVTMISVGCLEDFRDILPLLQRGAASPRELLFETLYGMPYEQVAERTVHFGCNCSEMRLMASLASLPKHQITELASSKDMLEIGCDFCGREYRFSPEQLRGLVDTN